MNIEFSLLQKSTPFGPISDPKIPVAVKTQAGYRTYRFLIDTGADFSLAPSRLAQQIGLTWEALPETVMAGVEQGGVKARMGHLPLRIGNLDINVRCLFVNVRKPLFLLGRADFLDRFVLTIDHPRQRIVLTEVTPP